MPSDCDLTPRPVSTYQQPYARDLRPIAEAVFEGPHPTHRIGTVAGVPRMYRPPLPRFTIQDEAATALSPLTLNERVIIYPPHLD